MLALHPRRTAIVGIDLQNWTLGLPIAPNSEHSIIESFISVASALRNAGGVVALTRAVFSSGYADMLRAPVDIPLNVPAGGMPDDAVAFHASIDKLHAEIICTKRQWSAFYGTELDLQFRRRGIETVIIGGVMTNFGVESTARDAWQHNYNVIVLQDVSSSLSEAMHQFSCGHILPRIARVRSSKEVLASIAEAL